MRNRRILVAAALVVLVVWATPPGRVRRRRPKPTSGPSPTGAIGSGPATFEPNDETESSSPTGTTVAPSDEGVPTVGCRASVHHIRSIGAGAFVRPAPRIDTGT